MHLILYLSPILKAFLLSFPPIVVDLPLVLVDAFLRTMTITTFGVDLAIQSQYRDSWFMQIAMGGICGSAAAVVLLSCNLWSPSGWRFTSENLSPMTWDVYGPFILSTIYVTLRGTHPIINNISAYATVGIWGPKSTGFLRPDEARTVVALIFATVVTLRRLGIYSFSIGRPLQIRALGSSNDKKVK